MIDSSGRRSLQANGTVLDMLPVGSAIALTGGLLIILFTLMRPEASHGLETMHRLIFWTLHVGLGLAAIYVSSLWLAAGDWLPSNSLARVLLAGCAGVAIAGPGYLILDYVYQPYLLSLDDDPEASSLLMSLVQEILDVAPWFLTAWVLINLPVLLPSPQLQTTIDDAVSQFSEKGSSIPDGQMSNASKTHVETRSFLETLPGVVGTDVIAVASDLHYLNVWTVAGRTTVLGNLKAVVAELGNSGLQTHRSHWVAHSHVQRIVGTASDGACIMSNELRVPISRRRWKTIREHYGRGVVHSAS